MTCAACGAETTRPLCARCDPDAPCGDCGYVECRCGPEVDAIDEAAHRRGHGYDVPMGG